jgi:mono/diheme cytochrome c family protein
LRILGIVAEYLIPEEENTVNLALGKKLAVVAVVLAMLALPLASFAADEAADLFKSKCAMCHGPDGSGKTAMGEKLKIKDLHSAEVQKQTDAELTGIITKGKEKMPSYESKLNKEQIAKLVAYVRDLCKKH